MEPNVSVEQIAKTCHQVNKAWCEQNGDVSQYDWHEAEEWQRQSAIRGVQALLDRPHMTTKDQHEAWMSDKVHDGWVWGATKDAEMKTHPCIVPYEELPAAQRFKDTLFQTVVRSFLPGGPATPVEGIVEPMSARA